MMTKKKDMLLTAVVCAASLALFQGCEDDDKDRRNSRPDAGDGRDDAEAGAGTSEAVYAIAAQVFGANDQTTYLRLKRGSLFEGALGSTGGVERVGRALVQAGVEPGSLYYAGDKAGEIDRYDVAGGGTTKGQTVSFSGEGVAGVAEYAAQMVMVSETKALYFDARTLKVLVWNPKTMELTKAISLADLALTGYSATFSTVTTSRGPKVYIPVSYRTPAAVPSQTAVVVVDTADDTAKVVKDDRCGYARDAAEGDDGKWYLATEAFGSSVHHLNGTAAPAPCLLRFDFDGDAFDPAFKVDLNDLADGKTVGSLIKLPNGKVYTRVLDEDMLKEADLMSGRALGSAVAWTWSEITLGDTPTLAAVPEGQLMGGSLIPMPLGDKLVVPNFASDLSKTTLCDMSEGPTCTVKTEVDGLVFSVAKLK